MSSYDNTTHIFKPVVDGGVQQVIAKDSKDMGQITLIRQHLEMEAAMFRGGNFSDPASLHGQNMAGLTELKNGASDITITYSDSPNGGQITYTTSDPKLVTAIHNWFKAQLSDHGSDAIEQ
ncbi:MAG: hypothetical protein EXR62_13495 [Chloroflexi bacterium]|nr:hypothetical protein [Chloroflexota bacterium]